MNDGSALSDTSIFFLYNDEHSSLNYHAINTNNVLCWLASPSHGCVINQVFAEFQFTMIFV